MTRKSGSMKRKALGRGLSALIPDATATAQRTRTPSEYFLCAIENIHAQKGQPRKHFDDKGLDELATSLAEHGVMQPLIVRPLGRRGGEFELIAGERRWRAAQRAGITEVPVLIREADDTVAFEMALIENIQREDLDPLDEAQAYQHLLEELGYTQERLAERVGKDRSTVANAVRLLKLPEAARRALAAGRISTGHARALLSLERPRAIQHALRDVEGRKLSVRQTEALVKQLKRRADNDGPGGGGAAADSGGGQSANVRDLQERLIRALKTRVKLTHRSGNKGRIEIFYNSLDELDRLLETLLK